MTFLRWSEQVFLQCGVGMSWVEEARKDLKKDTGGGQYTGWALFERKEKINKLEIF